MSASEDYLDQLLNGMSGDGNDPLSGGNDAPFSEGLSSDDDFLRQFEADLESGSDDFLKDFERELDGVMDDFGSDEDDDLFSFGNLDELVNRSRAEADDSFETMTPTSSRTSDENFNLGFDEAESEEEKPKAPEISPPESLPEDILNLLENVEGETPQILAPGADGAGVESAALTASADQLDEKPIEAYAGVEGEETDLSGLDNPEHVRKNADLDDEDIEAPDTEAIAAAAAAASGIQDENAIDADGEDSDDLLDLLNGIDEDGSGDLSDIGDLLNQDAAGVQELTPEEIENLQGELDEPEDEDDEKLEGKFHTKKERKKEKRKTGNRGGRGGDGDGKEKRPGFFARLLALFFNEAEDDIDSSEAAAAASLGADADIDDENLAILKELDAAGEGDNGTVPAEKKKKKEKKKKEKPKKEPKPKKEKPKKEPKPKKEKPKKEKKLREKDTSPPLPKVPVIMVGIFAASVMVFILLVTNLYGDDGTSVADATAYYEDGDYVAAFEAMNGGTYEGADAELFEKATILASIQKPYLDYRVLYSTGEYDMALDSLIRAIGRCYNFEEQAKALLITDTVARLRDQFADELLSVFGVDLDEAKEIYDERDREDYSIRIYDIIEALGLAKEED